MKRLEKMLARFKKEGIAVKAIVEFNDEHDAGIDVNDDIFVQIPKRAGMCVTNHRGDDTYDNWWKLNEDEVVAKVKELLKDNK